MQLLEKAILSCEATKFNDFSILITIISYDYLNLSLADEHVGDITIPTQFIEYNQNYNFKYSL
jgi:uncharacterized membrane protein